MEEAILVVLRQHLTGAGTVQTNATEIADWLKATYPHLDPDPADVDEIVRHMHRDGQLRLLYAEGGPDAVLEIRL
jgi:hypothetical protein